MAVLEIDPGQWRQCRVQGGYCQCGPISGRLSHESKTPFVSPPHYKELFMLSGTCFYCTLHSLQEFTQSCLRHEAKLRPTAHDLLFHRVLFEVHSLKLLAAHCLINNQCELYHRHMAGSPKYLNTSHGASLICSHPFCTCFLRTCTRRTAG